MPSHTTRRSGRATEIRRQGKILLFDERADALKRVRAMLVGGGHSVLACNSFSETVDHLTDESFDIVVIGQEGGLEEEGEVAEWARAVDSRMPVLMLLTDEKHIPGEGTRWKRDVSEYLRKPASAVEERNLMEAVQRYLKPKATFQVASQNPT